MGDGVRWLDTDERRIWLGWIMSTRLLWEEMERDLQRVPASRSATTRSW